MQKQHSAFSISEMTQTVQKIFSKKRKSQNVRLCVWTWPYQTVFMAH